MFSCQHLDSNQVYLSYLLTLVRYIIKKRTKNKQNIIKVSKALKVSKESNRTSLKVLKKRTKNKHDIIKSTKQIKTIKKIYTNLKTKLILLMFT
jgi:hypothetical protein